MQQLSQQPLALTIADFHRQRELPREFDHAVIEKRHARLEADGHRGAVDFDEYVVGQVTDEIKQHLAPGNAAAAPPCRRLARRDRRLDAVDDDRGGILPLR